MADSLRAIGWAAQSAIGTAMPPTAGSNFVEAFTTNPNLKYRVPKYKTNKRIMTSTVIPTTTYYDINIGQADVDVTECLPIFASAIGPASSGVYLFGGALNSTPASFLTVKWSEGLNQSWQVQDSRVNLFHLVLDAANGTLRWNGALVGLLSASQPGAAWAPTYTLPAGIVPYAPWQTILKRGSVAVNILNFELDLNNNYNPLFATAGAVPVAGQAAGLAPVRFTDGEAVGGFKLTYEYPIDAGSSYRSYLNNSLEAWHIIMTDPTPTTGKTITIDIPVVGWTQGQLDYTNAETRQILTGSALYDSGSGTSVKLTVA